MDRLSSELLNFLLPASRVIRDPEKIFQRKLEYTGFLKLCPGKHHAWYETNLGYPIRKELGKVKT
jgi:hypothetical protein